ncbi:MAG: hypothetical protein ACI3XQ_02085, partial [Eubacteriales bacterium]
LGGTGKDVGKRHPTLGDNETETGNETDTFEEATDESVNYNTDNSETTAEETNTKGCKSSVKGCAAAIVLISIFTALGIKKKEY